MYRRGVPLREAYLAPFNIPFFYPSPNYSALSRNS
jgi:hypothetical protein